MAGLASTPRCRVSVVIPAHDAEAFLGDAIASALAQTRSPHEVLVVDDASTDGTARVAEEWAARDARVRLLRMPENGGDTRARNAALAVATGELIAALDADDVWEPFHLEEVAGLLDRCPDAALACSAARLTGSRSGVWTPPLAPGRPVDAFWVALQRAPHAHSSTVMRRTALVAAAGYDEDRRGATDFDLWMRLAAHHPFVCTHRVTVAYRWHPAQVSANPVGQIISAHQFRHRQVERMRAAGSPHVARAEATARDYWRRQVRYSARSDPPRIARTFLALGHLSYVPPAVVARVRVRAELALLRRALRRALRALAPAPLLALRRRQTASASP